MRDLCVTADGEIRHYGWRAEEGGRRRVYIASRSGYRQDDEPRGPAAVPVAFDLTQGLLGGGVWHMVACTWNSETKRVSLEVDGKSLQTREMKSVPAFGLSYVHLQTLANGTDSRGACFRQFRMSSR